jgi:hypothetical protein
MREISLEEELGLIPGPSPIRSAHAEIEWEASVPPMRLADPGGGEEDDEPDPDDPDDD